MKLNLKINVKAAVKVQKEVLDKTINMVLLNEEMKNQCNLIDENIYLSNYKYASNKEYLNSNEITHIVNSAAQSNSYTPVFFDDICYLALNIRDDPSYNLISNFYKCIEFLELCIKAKNKVLIHCFEVIIFFIYICLLPTLLKLFFSLK